MPKRNYCIVRHYAPHLEKEKEVIRAGLTKAEAKRHCRLKSTRKEGEFFDSFTEGSATSSETTK